MNLSVFISLFCFFLRQARDSTKNLAFRTKKLWSVRGSERMKVKKNRIQKPAKHQNPKVRVLTSIKEYERIQNDSMALRNVRVEGNTSLIRTDHPVVTAIVERWAAGSIPGQRAAEDDAKIALCIEGGGMRGCVAAGSAAAINFLGLNDAIDEVYGSSAGAMVAAYFVSRQYSGIQIYHDLLPAAGKNFIDKSNLLPALGLPSFHRLRSMLRSVRRRVFKTSRTLPYSIYAMNFSDNVDRILLGNGTRSNSRRRSIDVINLHYLLDEVMSGIQRLDWKAFSANEQQQPLHIVTSAVCTMRTVLLSRKGGHYHDIPSLLQCIRASMMVPGIAGQLHGISSKYTVPFTLRKRRRSSDGRQPISVANGEGMNNDGENQQNAEIINQFDKSITASNDTADNIGYITPLVDAFLCEPMPYRSAVRHGGASHVVVLRTRPDPSPVLLQKPGIYEAAIARRFFTSYAEDAAIDWLEQVQHHRIYAEDILRLNDAVLGEVDGIDFEGRSVHLLPVAITYSDAVINDETGHVEIGQLEADRERILHGMRAGARRALHIFYPAMRSHWQNSFNADTAAEIDVEIEEMVDSILPMSMLERKVSFIDYDETTSTHYGQQLQ